MPTQMSAYPQPTDRRRCDICMRHVDEAVAPDETDTTEEKRDADQELEEDEEDSIVVQLNDHRAAVDTLEEFVGWMVCPDCYMDESSFRRCYAHYVLPVSVMSALWNQPLQPAPCPHSDTGLPCSLPDDQHMGLPVKVVRNIEQPRVEDGWWICQPGVLDASRAKQLHSFYEHQTRRLAKCSAHHGLEGSGWVEPVAQPAIDQPKQSSGTHSSTLLSPLFVDCMVWGYAEAKYRVTAQARSPQPILPSTIAPVEWRDPALWKAQAADHLDAYIVFMQKGDRIRAVDYHTAVLWQSLELTAGQPESALTDQEVSVSDFEVTSMTSMAPMADDEIRGLPVGRATYKARRRQPRTRRSESVAPSPRRHSGTHKVSARHPRPTASRASAPKKAPALTTSTARAGGSERQTVEHSKPARTYRPCGGAAATAAVETNLSTQWMKRLKKITSKGRTATTKSCQAKRRDKVPIKNTKRFRF